jgi:hypothetical protein
VQSPSISQGVLFDISGSSQSDVWALGGVQGPPVPPFVFHYDGTRWTKIKDLVPYGNLTGVVAISSTDAWIVGWTNFVFTLHWDGLTWTKVPAPSIGSYDFVYAVDASSSTDAWLVGNYTATNGNVLGLTEHWDGSTWTLIPAAGKSAIFYDVAAIAPDDAWAVGFQGTPSGDEPLAEHWDGSTWSIVPMVNPIDGASNEMTGVSAASSNDVWAVGFGGSAGNALIEHWDGTSWSRVDSPKPKGAGSTPLFDVAVASASDVWAVGESNAPPPTGSYRPLAEHWDGTAWSLGSPPVGPRVGNFLAVSEVTATDVWAVGAATAADGLPRPFTEHSTGCSL